MSSALSLSIPLELQRRIETMRTTIEARTGKPQNRSHFYSQLLEGALLKLEGMMAEEVAAAKQVAN